MKAKVMIAIPNMGQIHVGLTTWLLKNVLKPRDDVEHIVVIAPNGLVPHDSARNFCVQAFLKSDNTHLFFIDSDITPPDDAIEKLLGAGVDIVSGVYYGMRYSKETGTQEKVAHVYTKEVGEDGKERLRSVSGEGVQIVRRCGGGCLMISRSALERITPPWFSFRYDETGNMTYGEDIYFCIAAEASGFTIHANFDVVCKHAKEVLL